MKNIFTKNFLGPVFGMSAPLEDEGDVRCQQALAAFFSISSLPGPEVGGRIRAWRIAASLSQRELAEHASEFLPPELSLSQVDISRIESNPGKMTFAVAVAICKVLSHEIYDMTEEIPEAQ